MEETQENGVIHKSVQPHLKHHLQQKTKENIEGIGLGHKEGR